MTIRPVTQSTSPSLCTPQSVSLLILGAGWTSTFLIPLLASSHPPISHAATTRDGRDGTIKFVFSPNANPSSSADLAQYRSLPSANVVLITFPLTSAAQSHLIVSMYHTVHGSSNHWIQLGSTGIFAAPQWNDHKSTYDKSNARAQAEDALLELGGCVMNLAGLYGGSRSPKSWVKRVATSKEQVKEKKALHLIHGEDVARGIVAVHRAFVVGGEKVKGERWLLTDLRVYDWWDLIMDWGAGTLKNENSKTQVRQQEGADTEKAREYEETADVKYRRWVGEAMIEENVRSLPRSAETLGRVLDSRAFWQALDIWPSVGRAN